MKTFIDDVKFNEYSNELQKFLDSLNLTPVELLILLQNKIGFIECVINLDVTKKIMKNEN